MSGRLDPAVNTWMAAHDTREVLAALKAAGGEVRFVGGAVRNALAATPVTDIDIATTLVPGAVIRALTDKVITAIPTGIEHGTITAVVRGRPFEITTLRRDVSTDGRRAAVAFTTDWTQDARRRDFTMNAIYAAEDGTLFDPAGGIADLEKGRVRFVGDAAARIREDYLRILRLFRFHAWYGRGALDAEALAAAIAEKAGLKRLSGERVQKELLRLLEAPDPMPSLKSMHSSGILVEILPEPVRLGRLENLLAVTREVGLAPDPLRALAALLPSVEAARMTAAGLRLSNAARARLIDAAVPDGSLAPSLSLAAAARQLYRVGSERFIDRLLLRWAEEPKETRWKTLFIFARDWTRPEFPVDGRDAMAAGAAEGPAVGRALAAVERWWVEQDFAPGRPALLAKLREAVAGKT